MNIYSLLVMGVHVMRVHKLYRSRIGSRMWIDFFFLIYVLVVIIVKQLWGIFGIKEV